MRCVVLGSDVRCVWLLFGVETTLRVIVFWGNSLPGSIYIHVYASPSDFCQPSVYKTKCVYYRWLPYDVMCVG